MAIVQDLISGLPDGEAVRSVLVGAHCTAVCSRRCGLASTVSGGKPHSHDRVRNAGRLHHMNARELAEYAFSANPLEASIGIAAINSLLEVDERNTIEINALDILMRRGQGRDVALVGHFPFVPLLRESVGRLWVIELDPAEGDYPAEAAADLIPQADIVALTGSALINHTLDTLLSLCRPGSQVMILGPSTPLSPVLFSYGARILCGAVVIDEAAVLHSVGQGAAFHQVEGVRLLSMTASAQDLI